MPSSRHAFYALLLAVFFLFCCGGGGCPSSPGGRCDPLQEETCTYGYYCAAVGICTLHCQTQADCDRNRACVPATTNPCTEGGTCIDGFCGGRVECIEGYCQAPCAHDASCNYDPYEPGMREED